MGRTLDSRSELLLLHSDPLAGGFVLAPLGSVLAALISEEVLFPFGSFSLISLDPC